METDYITTAAPAAGAAYGTGEDSVDGPRSGMTPSGASLFRKRLNLLALCENILLPSAIFAAVFGLMSFSIRYNHVQACWFLLACGLAIAVGFGIAGLVKQRKAQEQGQATADWYLFLSATCFLAWVLGLLLGSSNYSSNMERYFDMAALSTVRDVDPGNIPGRQYLDVGGMYFKEHARVAEELSLGFKDDHVYCVAPIVLGNNSRPPASYDFWVVGVDCCVAIPPARFWCGDQVNLPDAHAGLRYMGDKSYFKLGIQQAVSEYHYAANNPIFFTWTTDPVADIESWHYDGKRFFVIGVFVYVVFQTLCTAGMAYWYATRGKLRLLDIPVDLAKGIMRPLSWFESI